MSVTGIAASSLFSFLTQTVQSKKQQFQQEFQQLGQDLQSGNMSAAQSDFATLKQDMPQSSSTTSSSAQSGSGIATAFSQLAQDLQSGNLTAAQSDYATLQQDFQSTRRQASPPAVIITTITEGTPVPPPVQSASCSMNWERHCNPEAFPMRSKPTVHCNRIYCK